MSSFNRFALCSAVSGTGTGLWATSSGREKSSVTNAKSDVVGTRSSNRFVLRGRAPFVELPIAAMRNAILRCPQVAQFARSPNGKFVLQTCHPAVLKSGAAHLLQRGCLTALASLRKMLRCICGSQLGRIRIRFRQFACRSWRSAPRSAGRSCKANVLLPP